MERHHKLSESMITDELAVTKAAAWAWYQRGSGSEPKPTSEFGLTRTHRVPNPTRYKLEAERSSSSTTSDHGNSHLLDRYEIESISKQLENYIERSRRSSNSSSSSASGRGGGHHRRREVVSPGSDVTNGMIMIKKQDKEREKEKNERRRISKGYFGLTRHGVAVACGVSRDDVVEFGGGGVRERRRRPENGGGRVVGAATSQPRTAYN